MKSSKKNKYDIGIVDSKKYDIGSWFVAAGLLLAGVGFKAIADAVCIKTYPEFLSACEKEMKRRGIFKETETDEDMG